MRDDIGTGADTTYLQAGTPAYRRVSRILFIAGFSTFATLYCVQPLLPDFVREFGVSPAESSLSLSLTTGVLAVALLVAGAISDGIGRKPVMVTALLAAGILGIVGALMPDWNGFLAIRALEGLALSGLPAVAMAYVSEEVDPRSTGVAMGLYIGGTAIGGMSGRVLTAVVTDIGTWRLAVGVVGALAVAAALAVWLALPPSRHFVRRAAGMRALILAWRSLLTDAGLLGLFSLGFLLMGGFVTVFNYIGFRLSEPPFALRPAVVGAVFLVYSFGVVSSPLFGGWSGRFGSGRTLAAAVALMVCGLALLEVDSLFAIAPGIALFTFAFFGAHSTVSAWIGRRAAVARGQASSIYLFCYYLGSTLAGTLGGLFWHAYGWTGVAAFVALLLLAAVAVTIPLLRSR
ncbi:MFS transporter [Azospirillum picis]|uniref:YNFM family putative membrane transporter n=1 Tax=Azospirillum picis TaxID=488438 RepID=A0ABU0MG79_9PROT|nr:MFS transporter [Azospirillum picis]MBP2298499.1 YNFM family putative membrane transporter [Azospirillum picis]MDQ0532452.1 YNFM family putative membrane transporter [Azospirillum picis]